jgi:hypothetical protein
MQQVTIELKPGDIFCSASNGILGKSIRWFERLFAIDDSAIFNHAGIITSCSGDTVEALSRGVVESHVSEYYGKRVLVGRHTRMNQGAFLRGFEEIAPEIGDVYPFWRLVLHAIPGASKWIASGKWFVCSELTAKFLNKAVDFHDWAGVTPDYLADAVMRWRVFDIVADGVAYEDWRPGCYDYREEHKIIYGRC